MAARNVHPSRGEVWLADLKPVKGHEQGGRRPCLVVSSDIWNRGVSGQFVVVPITSKRHAIPIRVPIDPPEGGVRTRSFILPEMIRSLSSVRFHARWGSVSKECMTEVEERIRALLDL